MPGERLYADLAAAGGAAVVGREARKIPPGFYVAESVKEGHLLKTPSFDVKMDFLG